MSAFRILINGRCWEGDYASATNAVFGAMRADENHIYAEAKQRAAEMFPHKPGCAALPMLPRWDWKCDCPARHDRRNWMAQELAAADHRSRNPASFKIEIDAIPTTKSKKIHRVA